MLLSSTGLAAIACENPSLPTLPPEKGRIREREEHVIELETLRYFNDMKVYVACVRDEHETVVREAGPSVESSLIARRNNAAVAELEAVRAVYEERIGPLDERAIADAEAERRAAAFEQWKLDDPPAVNESQIQTQAIQQRQEKTEEIMRSVAVKPTSTEERARRAQEIGN